MARVMIGTSGWHYASWRGPSEGVTAEEATRILRDSVSHDRIERRFLPHPNAGSRPKLEGTNSGELCLCLEGIAIHHALEAAFRELGQ